MWKLSKMHSAVILPDLSRLPMYNEAIVRAISVSSHVNDTLNLKPWTKIPGPKSYPFIGPLFSFLPGGELHNLDGTERTKALYAKYGPIVKLDKIVDKKPMIFLYDAESSAQILRGESQMPVRRGLDSLEYYRKVKKNSAPDSPTGLLTEQGEMWQKFRSTVNPALMHPKTMRLYTSVIDEVALEMIERLKSMRDDKNMISNLDREMYLWSLESVGVVALGCRMNCFDHNLDADSPAKQLIELVQNILKSNKDLDYSLSMWKYYPTKTFKKAMEYYKIQEDLAKLFIDQAMNKFQLNHQPDDQKSVLEKLLDINKEFAIIMASDMLMGGVDTVTNSVLGAFYLLASNPDKQCKLRAELKSDDKKRPYLKACVKETLRVMPVTFGNKRETTKEYNILGYKIPKGMNVIFANQEMSIMDKYFVKPHEYIPERWMVNKDDPLCYMNGHPFAYIPFGFGARACIGRRIAELEMETLIARAIENFEIEWFGPPPKVEQTLVNQIKGPYNFIFKDVKN